MTFGTTALTPEGNEPLLPGPDYAIAGLHGRPGYQHAGSFSPLFLPVAVGGLLVSAFAGWLTSWVWDFWIYVRYGDTPLTGFRTYDILIYFCLPLLGMAAVGFTYGQWMVRRTRVRSASLLWLTALLWGLSFTVFMRPYQSLHLVLDLIGEEPVAWISIGFLAGHVLASVIGGGTNMAQAAGRILYPTGGGTWAREEFAYFQPRSGNDVVSALEAGDAARLAQLRTEGPTAVGNSFESFTVLLYSSCPGPPDLPGYLYIRDIKLGNAANRRRVRGRGAGPVQLRDAQLRPEEIRKLALLVPGIGSAPPEENSSPGRVALESGPCRMESARGSYVAPLPPGEHCSLRMRYALVSALTWGLLLIPFPAACLGVYLDRLNARTSGAPYETLAMAAGITCAVTAVLALLVYYFRHRLVRGLFIRAVRSRRMPLFKPGPDALLLNVEDARTYHRTKLLPDDFAVASVSGGVLQLEMSRHRAHLLAEDLSWEVASGSEGSKALQLNVPVDERTWSVTLSDLEALLIPLQAPGDAYTRAETLRRRIQERLGSQ